MKAGPLVLVVDDDGDARNIVRIVLEYSGYRVAEATGGRGGLRAVCELKPRLIITELGTRTLAGAELLALVHTGAGLEHTRVIATCASDFEADALAAGFDAFLRKPLHVPLLIATVRRLCPLVPPPAAAEAPPAPEPLA